MTENDWPGMSPAWPRLVEQAWGALFDLKEKNTGEFRSAISKYDGYGPVEAVASHIATEAILDLCDRGREWARPIDWRKDLSSQLAEPDPISVLQALKEELVYDHEELARIGRSVESDMGAKPLVRVLPTAVAAVAAAHVRARLVDPTPAAKLDPGLLATLLLQARALVSNDWLATMRAHPYAAYQVARGLSLGALLLAGPESKSEHKLVDAELSSLKRAVRDLTERLLARGRIGTVRDGENVALVFCAGILAFDDLDPRYVVEALAAAAVGQSHRGDWPQGRVIGRHVDPDTGGPLVISSQEVGLAFAEAVFYLNRLPGAVDRLPPEVAQALQRSVDYVRESRVPLAAGDPPGLPGLPIVGWDTEHVYGHTQVEAKATAAALRLTVVTRAVAEQERNARALEYFGEDVWSPSDHMPDFLKWEQYMKDNEPDHVNTILPYLNEHFVEKALVKTQQDLRPWVRTESMSAILFGPPGTTKTTIVKSMAQGLEWPLVTLSPGTFIRDGLEHVERRAIEVFAHLRDLVRVVVLFDECDELFRARGGAVDAGNSSNEAIRSISAFMTASMLPKLQDLRDNGQAFFVIATNYFDQIDPAAGRIGRIDRVVGVSWPDQEQRENIIRRQLEDTLSSEALEGEPWPAAITRLAEKTQLYVRGELVELANALADKAQEVGRTERAVHKVIDEQIMDKQTSAIGLGDAEAFQKIAVRRSACHHPGQGEMKELKQLG